MLARCLAIGLTAAVHAGRYHLESTFRVHESIERAGWDLFDGHEGPAPPPRPAGPPALAVTSASDTAGHEPGG